MQPRREELREELIALFGASRELAPEDDRFLAELFLRRLEHRAEVQAQRRRKSSSNRAGWVFLAAVLALAIGTPLSLRSETIGAISPSPRSCMVIARQPAFYASLIDFQRDAQEKKARGYTLGNAPQLLRNGPGIFALWVPPSACHMHFAGQP